MHLARRTLLIVLTAVALCSASARAAAPAAPPAGPPAGLAARAVLLFEADSGTVVFSEHANRPLPIASTTKLMTAFVTLAREPPGKILVEQPYHAGPGESIAGVPAGTRLRTADMLRAMLLPSGNDVAHSLAIDVGGSLPGFVALMNEAAASLKLGNTRYTTPIGLDTPPGNVSTATDLARLADALLREPLFAKIVAERRAQLGDGLVVTNRIDLVQDYPWIVGVKSGYTRDAGYCMVGAATISGVHLISVVLGAPSIGARDAATLALLRYGSSRYRSAVIATAGRSYATVAVDGRPRPVRLLARRSLALVLARTTRLTVSRVGVPSIVTGPLRAGAVEGHIVIREDGRRVASVALVTARAVRAPPSNATLLWALVAGGLVIVLLGCSLPLVRRRVTRRAPEVLR